MTLTALEHLPLEEMLSRHARTRQLLAEHAPKAGGLLVTLPLNIYYLTGTLGTGVFWLPLDGAPVLCLRKGLGRALVESPLQAPCADGCAYGRIESFRSFKELEELCAPLTAVMAVDMNGFTWAQAELLRSRLPGVQFVAADKALARARMIKSPWELRKLHLAGARHALCLQELLPQRIRPGMTEREIGLAALHLFMEHGHSGLVRQSDANETFLGYVSAGESGLYPTGFDGPLGSRGMHPSTPYLGDAGTVWKNLLTLDLGFVLEGYNTDKTVTCWAGPLQDDVKAAFDCSKYILERISEVLLPGAIPSELWEQAQMMAASAGYAHTFMGAGPERVRFLGHGIGLEVDEFPVLAKGFDEPLKAGMVLALEPKIAIPGLGMVGVEDTFAVGANKTVSLTGSNDLILF